MIELEEYHKSLKMEIETRMLTLESGGNKTQLFTHYAIDLLKANGDVDNVCVAYDEETNPGRKPHKINAFSFSDDYTTISLFVTICSSSPSTRSSTSRRVRPLWKR